ncbi:hypothetical protein HZQ13_04490 [Elizabethkingia anophelis]|nr:hypothetical protein [Elizabethkingia anophelis]
MNILSVDFENCFGIGKLNYEFNFNESNSFVIYAPNGTMKTSFAKTLDLISKNDIKNQPKDNIYDKKSKFKVLVDGNSIDHNAILVVNAEDNTFDATDKISSFIASKELKKKYDDAYSELENAKSELLKKLKTISQSSDCEGEYISAFRENEKDNFLDILSKHVSELKLENDNRILFKYNSIFDTKGNVKKFLTKHEGLLDDYINNYNNIISNSKLFKLTSENTFGTYQANEIIKSIEDNAYFAAGHIFVLEDGTKIRDAEQLKTLYEEELENILKDEALKKSFDKVDKAIGANAELREFKKVIEENNSLLIYLKNYDEFKKKVWISFLSEIKDEVEVLSKLYEYKKKELETIIDEAKKEVSLWNEIIYKFNSRFYVPFDVVIRNQQDIILRKETANLEFIYKDNNEVPSVQTKQALLKILSKGEQRAYFILQFLFEIESRNQMESTTLLVFDDIADSFDYKNKYAIIEYIRDLHLSTNFKLLILTHNFDFYRTLSSRLELIKQSSLMVTKDGYRNIELKSGLYTGGIFKDYLKKAEDPKVFISLIAFVRNIIEYSDSAKVEECKVLTSCLHYNSKQVTIKDLKHIFKNRIFKLKDKEWDFDDNVGVQDFIFSYADIILEEENIDEILLENKIILAMASRIKLEYYIVSKFSDIDLDTILFNQTRVLSTKYKSEFPESKNLDIIDKINLMTPENIHLNAFMYEPLIDMSVFHLIDLYKKIKNID